jgi:phosphonate transport system substrate-binding protein
MAPAGGRGAAARGFRVSWSQRRRPPRAARSADLDLRTTMHRTPSGFAALAVLASLVLSAFQSPAPVQEPPKPAPKPPEREAPRAKDAPLRISGLLGADKEKQVKDHARMCAWLSKELNRKVELVPVADEAAAIAGLAANEIDMVWLSGLGAVRAEEATLAAFPDPEGRPRCRPIFARVQDSGQPAYLVAHEKLVEDGTFAAVSDRKPMPLSALAALKPKLAARTIVFDAQDSVSGSILPRHFLALPEVGVDPDKGFKTTKRLESGGGAAVLAEVASGASELGFVSAGTWVGAEESVRASAPVIYVTPPTLERCMVIHYRLGPSLPMRLMSSFLKLDPAREEHKAVLDLFGAERFVEVHPAHLQGLRDALESRKQRAPQEAR